MASAEQIKALIKSHYSSDSDQFTTLALQVAASEARKGHTNLAADIKQLVTRGKKNTWPLRALASKNGLDDILQAVEPTSRLSTLIANNDLKEGLERIILEFKQRSKLEKHGLSHRRKILLTGPPGTGKTMTATIIAKELGLPLYLIYTDKIITKYMGETAAKLRQVFDFISMQLGVYLFDEFDAIGAERSRDNDVGEIRRVLNSFLQFLEEDDSPSFVIAATNHLSLLDQALFRRFDDVLFYYLPTKFEVVELIRNRLANFGFKFKLENIPAKNYEGLSHAEITQACDDAIKASILSGKVTIQKPMLLKMLTARKQVYGIK
ncbi:MAG: ATP-binding protein [Bacteroidota bacterium]